MTINTRIRNTILGAAFAASLVSLGGLSALAQDITGEHLEVARKTLTASHATDPFDQILPGLANRLKTERIAVRPDLNDQISALVDIETLKLAPRRGDLEAEAANVYAKVFSIEELKAITAFFESPAGLKYLDAAPAISKALGDASRIWAGGIARDLAVNYQKAAGEQGLE